MNFNEQPKYYNAKQVYDVYGIGRAALGQLAIEGRVSVRRVETEVAVINLYSVADLEKVINGGDNEER